jgi:outer membrane protein OmpA-like peptidoglycan-associated protein
MIKFLKTISVLFICTNLFAGNSDRAGEAGAYELLITPQARTMGMFGINSANVRGVDAFGTNIGGLAMNRKISVMANYTSWLSGTETSLMNLGVAGEISPGNNLGFNVNYLSYGKIPLTTTANGATPLGTFSPFMLNLGFSFARRFSKYVNGGVTLKLITEGISNVSATGAALDAGLQYTTGDLDDIHFGVHIRNIGFPMQYSGDGLTVKRPAPGSASYEIPYNLRAAKFELPTQFSIAFTKDLYFGKMPETKEFFCKPAHRLSLSGSFIYNPFIENDYGIGAEYAYREKFAFRFGYLYQTNGIDKETTKRAHMGIAAGFSVDVPMSKSKNPSVLEISYNYRPSWVFAGTHNVGFTYMLSKGICDDYEVKKLAIAEVVKEAKPIEKPKVETRIDTVLVQLPPKIETVVQYRDVNKMFKDFAQRIEFKTASAQLTLKGMGALDVIGDLMRNYPENKFNVIGHTDEMGKPENNMTLSKNRAIAVAKYLIASKSIPENAINVEWFGQEKPIADNRTEEGRQMNRRVEITLVDDGNLKNTGGSSTTNKETPSAPKTAAPKTEPAKIATKPTTPASSSSTGTAAPANSLENDLKEDAKSLKFIMGSDSIKKIGLRTTTRIAANLADATFTKIKIVSHTDNGKYAVSNMEIATKRAEAIKKLLSDKGVPAAKIETEAKGDSMPLESNDSETGKEANNRIELILIK